MRHLWDTGQFKNPPYIKSVKNVRVKTRTYAQWSGGFYRKSTPLFKEHYLQLYKRELFRKDVNKLFYV